MVEDGIEPLYCSGCGEEIEPYDMVHLVKSGYAELARSSVSDYSMKVVAPGEPGYANHARSKRALCNECYHNR